MNRRGSPSSHKIHKQTNKQASKQTTITIIVTITITIIVIITMCITIMMFICIRLQRGQQDARQQRFRPEAEVLGADLI